MKKSVSANRSSAKTALQSKIQELQQYLQNLSGAVLGFSGGVDSSLLAVLAYQALPKRFLALTVELPGLPKFLLQQCRDFARDQQFPHQIVWLDQFAIPEFAPNHAQRCYFCKQAILRLLRHYADANQLPVLLDGGNLDDLEDFRPGSRAVQEAGVLSPFQELGWNKKQIRAASQLLGLSSANLPSYACLASRIPHDNIISPKKLRQIETVEFFLHQAGCPGCRARHHDNYIRLEVNEEDFQKLAKPEIRQNLLELARKLDIASLVLDLQPYRSGRLNQIDHCQDQAQS